MNIENTFKCLYVGWNYLFLSIYMSSYILRLPHMCFSSQITPNDPPLGMIAQWAPPHVIAPTIPNLADVSCPHWTLPC